MSTPFDMYELVHTVIAGYMLRYKPVHASFHRIRCAKKVEEVISGLDSKITEGAKDVDLILVDHIQATQTLTYRATSGGKSYIVKIRALKEKGVRHYWEADVKLSCSCPFWRYGGSEYHASEGDYLYAEKHPRGTLAVPKIRDKDSTHYVCKHVLKALQKSKRIYFDRS